MIRNKLIYTLCCPVTGEVHYIGKTTQGMTRPLQHLRESHNHKIKEWVNDLKELGYKPIIKIIEQVDEYTDLDSRELYWIQKHITDGSFLLNVNLIKPVIIHPDISNLLDDSIDVTMSTISEFVKRKRKYHNITQEDFALRAGVSLTVVRKIEQGKTNINLDGLLQVLRMFGHTIEPKKPR
jgi:y4mF family transcriptional regulator